MKIQRFGVRLALSIVGAVAIASLSQSGVLAQNDHGHSATAERRPDTPEGVARRARWSGPFAKRRGASSIRRSRWRKGICHSSAA